MSMTYREVKTQCAEHPAGAISGLEWDTPMYRLAVRQLDQTAELMGLDPNIWERLRTPQRAHFVSFPFRRDDYETLESVFVYRFLHLLTMGPTKGCIRYYEDIRLGVGSALSHLWTWQCAMFVHPVSVF